MVLQTTTRRAFGRRATPQAQPAAPTRTAPSAEPVVAMPPPSAKEIPTASNEVFVDHEVLAWKEARGSKFTIPWRQIYLMASLCFGVASFVLPDSVNDNVDYLLWGLMAMSAYAWYATRKKKTDVKDPAVP
jgi:hypothetical protein